MKRNPFSRARTAETPGPAARCFIFQWIGQSFDTCDECSRPRREHLYDPCYGGGRPELYVKKYVEYADRWEWAPVTVIRRDRAPA